MHLDTDFEQHLKKRFNIEFSSIKVLTGGDINSVYRLSARHQSYVLKLNNAETFPDLFQKEANGLNALKACNAIDVPEVFGYGNFGSKTYLLLEYKPSGEKRKSFWKDFGHQLAELHRNTQSQFGFFEDNYIGSLPQFNKHAQTASEFYIEQRLKPQFEIAAQKGYNFQSLNAFYRTIRSLIPEEPPALIHGDLWSGNYLVNTSHQPCLIDPAVAYAPREMDLAMMKLFGGFNETLFVTYHEDFPLKDNWEKRIKLYQLYYVLSHLNLFGRTYYNQAKQIVSLYQE